MSNYIYNPDSGELYHYGVKGMKWGVRKKPEYVTTAKANMKSAKAARRTAKVDRDVARGRYNDSFNRAYNYTNNHPVSTLYNKRRKETEDKLWDEAQRDAATSREAKRAYKQSKKDYRQAKRDYQYAKNKDKYERHGLDYDNPDHIINVHNYGMRGAQRIQKRMEKTGMSDFKASMIETGRSAAINTLATAGVIAVAAYMNAPNQVLDASGKVIKRFY